MRNIRIIALITLVLLVGCKEKPTATELHNKIENLQKTASDKKVFAEIAKLEMEFIKTYADDSLTHVYKQSVLEHLLLAGKNNELVHYGEKLLASSKEKARYLDYAPLVGQGYVNLDNKSKAVSIYEVIAKKRVLTRKELSQLGNLYLDIFDSEPLEKNVKNLLSGANAMVNVGNYTEALSSLKIIYEKFPKSEYAPYAIMQIANVYEQNLKNIPEAEKAYKKIIDTYPSSKFSKDAQIILERGYLGKTNEELIKLFQKQNK